MGGITSLRCPRNTADTFDNLLHAEIHYKGKKMKEKIKGLFSLKPQHLKRLFLKTGLDSVNYPRCLVWKKHKDGTNIVAVC